MDTLFHTSLIITLREIPVDFFLEKNEVITLETMDETKSINDKTEFFQIIPDNEISFDDFLNNSLKLMGSDKFYDYDGFYNNCQDFIEQTLEANNFYSPEAKAFLKQPTTNLGNDLKNNGFSYVPKVMNKITSLASIASRLSGKGTTDDALDSFDKYMIDKNLTTDDLDIINENFIIFINSEGIKFI